MQTDELNRQVNEILEEASTSSNQSEEPITDADFTEPIEGEVVENPPKPKGISIKWLIPVGITSLALALIGVLVIAPLFSQSATILITPDRQTISVSATIDAPVRKLLTKSLTLSQQVNTTGKAYQAASAAYGYITFYNSLPSPQVIPAGTMLIGTDGTHVITDIDAYIPAGMLSVNGSVVVSAHTTTTGVASNILAGDINGACCRDYVFARNNAFSGGQDAREYPTPTKTDIQKAVSDMTSILQESIVADAQGQLHPGEAALPPQCKIKSASDTALGGEATKITVSLISTCSIYSYNASDVTKQEQTAFAQAVTMQLGNGYVPDKAIQSHLTSVKFQNTGAHIVTNLSGNVVYHFTDNDIQRIKALIAGKSQAQATALLLGTRGIRMAGIQIAQQRTTLPSDYRAIIVDVYQK